MKRGLDCPGLSFFKEFWEVVLLTNRRHQKSELQLLNFNQIQPKMDQMSVNQDSYSQQQSQDIVQGLKNAINTEQILCQADFIGQFLQIDKNIGNSRYQNENKLVKAAVSLDKLSEKLLSEDQNSQNSTSSKKSKSIFHNFQKHLVTTLKMNITINKINIKNDPTVHLAQKMWKIFEKSNYFSKKILYFLFGVSEDKKQIIPLNCKKDKFTGFNQISSIYPPQEIQLAQEYLRQQVVRQGKRLLSRNLLTRRRMQKGQQFESYFQRFIEQIENGQMRKRLPKPCKIKLLKSLNKQKHSVQ